LRPQQDLHAQAGLQKDGTVTAASSSSISDGAAAVLLMTEEEAKTCGLKPLARILGYASHAHEPEWFTTAPGGAIRKVLKQVDWQAGGVDLFEINEAFAVVTMAAMVDVEMDHEQVNVNGGSLRIGHPSAPLARASSPRWCTRCANGS